MSDIQLYLVEVAKDKDEARNLALRSATRLASGDLKLVDLIETCGEYLNSEDAVLKKNSLAYLADVLSQLPPKLLSLQKRKLLCDFVLSRVKYDTEGAGSCAKCLIALESQGKWDPDTAQDIVETFVLVVEFSVIEILTTTAVSSLMYNHYGTINSKVTDSPFSNY